MPRPLLVVAQGEPTDPLTWSGTPHHICDALAKRGMLFGTFSAGGGPPLPARVAAYVASRAYYFPNRQVGYGWLHRQLKAAYVRRRCQQTHAPAVLHLATVHLPFFVGPPPVPQYLLIDHSERLWSRYAVEGATRTGRLERDVHALERKTFAQMDQVFTVSEYVRQDLIEHYGVPPAKVTTVGTGRGKVRPFSGEKDYANGLMLFVGRAGSTNKGGALTLEAFQRARKIMPHLRMIVIGDEDLLAAARNVPNVEAHDQVPWETLQSFYERATLFVMPARHQPWGLAYLEALSCRMPIVGLDRLSTPELTGQGQYGFVLRHEDPDELARVMIDAYRDPQRLAVMGGQGQQFVLDRFTWELTVDRMLAKMVD